MIRSMSLNAWERLAWRDVDDACCLFEIVRMAQLR